MDRPSMQTGPTVNTEPAGRARGAILICCWDAPPSARLPEAKPVTLGPGPGTCINAKYRHKPSAERLDILTEVDGVWRFRTMFNCAESCPRGIEVTKAIQEVKRATMFSR